MNKAMVYKKDGKFLKIRERSTHTGHHVDFEWLDDVREATHLRSPLGHSIRHRKIHELEGAVVVPVLVSVVTTVVETDEACDWSLLEDETHTSMKWLGNFTPTAQESSCDLKGTRFTDEGDSYSVYVDADELKSIGVACLEVAAWLKARAEAVKEAKAGDA